MGLPRGIRNNNPGNIEDGIAWDGLDVAGDTDPRFARFLTPEMGIRAMVKIFITYERAYGLKSVAQIITRWAPPVENDTQTYIDNVCKWTGFTADEDVPNTPKGMGALAYAMARMECGTPYWTVAMYIRGAALALNVPVPEVNVQKGFCTC